MTKIILIISILLILTTCTKDKVSIAISMDGVRSELVGEWEWQYSQCRILTFINSEPDSYASFAVVDSGKFVLTHHITIHENGFVQGFVNNKKVFNYKLSDVNYELNELPETLFGNYKIDDSETTISLSIIKRADGVYLKTMHDFLQFPIGGCSNNYKAEYHVLKKL